LPHYGLPPNVSGPVLLTPSSGEPNLRASSFPFSVIRAVFSPFLLPYFRCWWLHSFLNLLVNYGQMASPSVSETVNPGLGRPPHFRFACRCRATPFSQTHGGTFFNWGYFFVVRRRAFPSRPSLLVASHFFPRASSLPDRRLPLKHLVL